MLSWPPDAAEARGGLHIVEQSLWAAVPAYMRKLSTALMKHCGRELPMGCTPVTFASWMGGDRDGNPNVTARTTHDVSLLARWMASDLFLREVDVLRFEVRTESSLPPMAMPSSALLAVHASSFNPQVRGEQGELPPNHVRAF